MLVIGPYCKLKVKSNFAGTRVLMADPMESVFSLLPVEMADSADWKLKLKNGTKLRCHSYCLGAVSPVLAVAITTSKKQNKNEMETCIPLPAYMDLEISLQFLRWVYHLDFTMSTESAHGLASLSHEWNIPRKPLLLENLNYLAEG